MQADRLGDEGFADTSLADEQQWTRVVEPSEGVDFLDFRLRDRAFRGEVEVFERGTHGELGGFDAIDGFSLLAVIGFGLQQRLTNSLTS